MNKTYLVSYSVRHNESLNHFPDSLVIEAPEFNEKTHAEFCESQVAFWAPRMKCDPHAVGIVVTFVCVLKAPPKAEKSTIITR